MSDAIDYIKQKGWDYREVQSDKGNEANVKICPYCHSSDYHFYINLATGQFFCHHGSCNQAGSLYTLKKYLGDVMAVSSVKDMVTDPEEGKHTIHDEWFTKLFDAHRLLIHDPDAMAYLSKRVFHPSAISHFVLGLWKENGINWLGYPYFRDGKLYNIKFRSLPPAEKAFKRIKGGQSLLFNEDVLEEDRIDEIVITEGEADAVALWSVGWHAVVGATIGAGGIEARWIDKLDRLQRVYFVFDRDIAGSKGAYKFANRLGLERCYQIRLPHTVKDLNEFFIQGGTLEQFQTLKEQARPFDVEDVKPICELVEDQIKSLYINNQDEGKLDLPWKSVQKLTGRFEPGDLVVLGARPGVGKTMCAINFLHFYASLGIPSLIFELEMRPERLVPRLIGNHLHKDSKLVNNMVDLTTAYKQIKDFPLYFAYKYRKLSWQIVEDTIRMCARRYGPQFVVFDNIHFLSRGEDPTREVSLMVNNLKLLAEELAIVMLAIARPRKMGEKKIMSSEDLAWSADIEGDADYIILLHRDRVKDVEVDQRVTEGIFMPKTLVRVDKARWDKGGDCYLRAIDDQCRFEEM